jgi:ABC transporter substrate binding protein
MASYIERRKFLATLGGAAVAWPLAARAQQGERMRRIGALMNTATESADGQARFAAFVHGLQQLGWTDGRNARLDVRWAAGDPERIRRYAAELVALAPDVILATGGTNLGPLRQVSRTVPTVFTGVSDPVGAGFVDSLARPGGNATGFISFEWNISGKWLRDLEKQSVVQLELPLGLEDEARRPGAKKGATRWLADRAVDMIRQRFGREAVGYASVVLGISHSIPDEFRELAEKEL